MSLRVEKWRSPPTGRYRQWIQTQNTSSSMRTISLSQAPEETGLCSSGIRYSSTRWSCDPLGRATIYPGIPNRLRILNLLNDSASGNLTSTWGEYPSWGGGSRVPPVTWSDILNILKKKHSVGCAGSLVKPIRVLSEGNWPPGESLPLKNEGGIDRIDSNIGGS